MNAMLLVLIATLVVASTLATASDPVVGGIGSESSATPATDPIRGKAVLYESGKRNAANRGPANAAGDTRDRRRQESRRGRGKRS